MADRGRGSSRGSGRGRGGGPSQGSGGNDKPQRQAIIDLQKHVGKKMRVKFVGGREVIGILRGFDQLLNLVMDDVEEIITDPENPELTRQRQLGLAVLRGTTVMVINPAEGFGEISNPFVQAE
ncbi:U6 snRNA-associated Sm-like protein LSm7 [Atractiella rhizophila]|nr:U6 snRNA-associated Sm-like protein LSm7 [Atractiella rhizophila]